MWLSSFLFTIVLRFGDAFGHFKMADQVPVYVNKVGPYANIHETYHYYYLPICRPQQIVHRSLTLGQVLDGDRMAESAFAISFQTPIEKQSLCGKKTLDKSDVSRLIQAVEEDYYAEMIIDDLKVRNLVGYLEEANVFPHQHSLFLFTHFQFLFLFNNNTIIEVGLEMRKTSAVELRPEEEMEIEFTYGVKWTETKSPLTERRKDGAVFFSSRTLHIHWLSIFNSGLLVVLLVTFVFVIVFSAVRRDLSKYNEGPMGGEEDLLLDNGWKTVAMDVFRKPAHPMLLSAIIGVGCQLLLLSAVILAIGTSNLMNVHRHGLLNSLSVVLYALTSGVAGFVSARKYASLDGHRWVSNINLTSFLFVGPVVVAWGINNTISWSYKSTQALPWTTVLVLLSIWLLLGYPLTVLGAFLGRSLLMNSAAQTAPFRTRTIPRELPRRDCTRSAPVQALLGGFLPFCAVSMELSYIFSTMWGREQYTLFYILFIVFFILIAVVACTSIALTYMQLNAENYHWWWMSVFFGGSVSVYIFGYGLFFLSARTQMSGVLQLTEFFTHLGLLCYAAFLAAGTVSHLSAQYFVHYMYSSVKSD